MRPIAKAFITCGDKFIVAYYPEDNNMSFFGGKIEECEISKITLLRELEEELGLKADNINKVEFIGSIENFFKYHGENGHHIGFYYHVDINDISGIKVQEIGRHEIKIFPLSDILNVEIYPNIAKHINEFIITGKLFHAIINNDKIAK